MKKEIKKEFAMEKLIELMTDSDLIGAVVNIKGEYEIFYFEKTAYNIAHFTQKYALTATEIELYVMEGFLLNTLRGGFIMNCRDQAFLPELHDYFIPLQCEEEPIKEIDFVAQDDLERFSKYFESTKDVKDKDNLSIIKLVKAGLLIICGETFQATKL